MEQRRIESIAKALEQGRVLEATYSRPDGKGGTVRGTRTLVPSHMFVADTTGNTILMAFDCAHGWKNRKFRLDRFDSLRLGKKVSGWGDNEKVAVYPAAYKLRRAAATFISPASLERYLASGWSQTPCVTVLTQD